MEIVQPGGGSGGGQVNSVQAGSGISVDSTDPRNPIVSSTSSGGSVTTVGSIDGSVTVTNATTTPDLSVVKAPKLTTARTIAGVSFDGTTNIAIPASGLSNGVTGSGAVVLVTSPTLVTPTLGVAAATSINKVAITAPATSATLTIADGKTLTASNTLTFTGTDTASIAFGTGGTVLYANQSITLSGDVTGSGSTAITTTVAKIAGTTVSGTTGSGNVVFATSPTLTTAALGSSTATTQSPADNSTKLATTAYVDAAVLGQNFKEAAVVATTGNLVGVYVSGVFTYTATGTDIIDGVSLLLGNRVLVKNQTTTFQNGPYVVTTAGSLGVAGVLTRTSDANTSGEFKTGDSIFVTSGTANANTTWAYTGVDSPTIGTDAITYAQTAGQGTITAGAGITVTGLSVAITAPVTVALGGTNATSASITAFNNITGYSAAGATGTTSTNLVFSTSPTLVTPILGAATATTVNKVTITAPASASTLTIADGKTFTASNTITLTGTDSVSMNVTNSKLAQVTLVIDGGGSAIANGTSSICVPVTFSGTITAYTITVDTGTCTITTWKKATGTAIPTVSDSISTSGVAISTGTVIRSTTVTDFTSTTVTANDLFIAHVTAIASATKISFTLEITKT